MDSVFPSEQLLSSCMKLKSLQVDCKRNFNPEPAVEFMALNEFQSCRISLVGAARSAPSDLERGLEDMLQ